MLRPPRSPLPHAALLGGALALACSAGARQAAAQAASQAAPPDVAEAGDAAIALPPISVTATRGPRPVDEVPATVTIIESEQLERQNANRPQDIIRYEPGISFGNQPGRTGGTNFVIRGIGENRVRVQVDGIRVPDFPGSNAGAGTFTRDFVDLESVKRIEILRGPASALYGSDALGGVVAYTLKDPRDYLAETNANTFLSGRSATMAPTAASPRP
ncbi:TonB-dependent siderophore receptor [Roseicella sp. DB1501]|uniref:TonB-dependent receptor plug domain-containing protein n=1 Tax=Roseicella sp. DB1501 TaxID=2730925 RepID=UPI0014911E79|nr:TonB-dependent receptor plug domain-containing protein [Roseicella sp. DB1501]NOG70869.1 TonB-dependent receptor plug domain-containing protein [Roseicella sp. DB1501]